ncbi:13868_t:CDS:2, partial [Acaulospora morrowiae]
EGRGCTSVTEIRDPINATNTKIYASTADGDPNSHVFILMLLRF